MIEYQNIYYYQCPIVNINQFGESVITYESQYVII